jgi:leucyl-tRNA synthetase
VACTSAVIFTSNEWKSFSEKQKQETLLNYRLAFRAETLVNWCPALGTVLANDEVKEGFSIRGGHPVEQRKMQQWLLRVSAYAERLLAGLDKIDWSESLKDIQRYWIGKSEGADMFFDIKGSDRKMRIFTTRPDTIYGVTFMVLAPESELVEVLTTPEKRAKVDEYLSYCKKRSERERMTETKNISGVFTGGYAIHPFTGEELPVWVSEYVLAGYGSGAIMAVPAHDERDYAFAKHFATQGLVIREVVSGGNIEEASYDAKEGKLINSPLINGLEVKDAIPSITREIESRGIGTKKVNYRLRDAIFSRQRYWGNLFQYITAMESPIRWMKTNSPLNCPK